MIFYRTLFGMIVLTQVLHYVITLKDYCVIGAGPAGLQMSYLLEKSGRDYIVFERDPSPGWFFKVYPRHRSLISINKRHTGKSNSEFNLRHDWNSLLNDDPDMLMTKYSKEFFPRADTLVEYMKDFAERFDLKIQYNTYIKDVSKNAEGVYQLKDKKQNKYECRYLIVSTGMWVEHVPKFVGIEHTVGYPAMSFDPDDYERQSVLILGRGNSGFETAEHLLGATNFIHMLSRNRIRLSWETHYVGDVRAVNDGPIDTYQLKSLDGQFERDLKTANFTKINGKIHVTFSSTNSNEGQTRPTDNLPTRDGYDTVLRCLGFKEKGTSQEVDVKNQFDRSIFTSDIRPRVSKVASKYPEIDHNYESTTSKNMFFAGTMAHSLDWRKSAGGFIHGFRYTTRALHRYLEWRNHGVHWPSVTLPNTELMNYLLKRLNEAAGIYQMFSTLSDVIILHDDGTFEYFNEIPIRMLSEFEEHTGRPFKRGIVVNFEYGKNFSGPGSDPFREDRSIDVPQDAHSSNFLHPVLYYYDNGIPHRFSGNNLPKPKRLHHMVEDFLTEWLAQSTHILPLRWFLENCLGSDLRQFYADTCFEYAMTGLNPPPTCKQTLSSGLGLARPVEFEAIKK